MQRIEQPDQDEGRQHGRRRHRHAILRHAPPGRAQGILPPRPEHQCNDGRDQHEEQRVGPEQHDLDAHCNLTRGSARV
jgi:hypothetical protein